MFTLAGAFVSWSGVGIKLNGEVGFSSEYLFQGCLRVMGRPFRLQPITVAKGYPCGGLGFMDAVQRRPMSR